MAGRGDDDFLGAGGEMALGFFGVGEQAGGFDDVIDAQLLPRKLAGLLGGHDALDLVAVDDERVGLFLGGVALAGFDCVLEFAVDRIVFELIGEIIRIRGDIDDGDDIDCLAKQALIAKGLEDQPADAAETIDTDFERGH